MIISQLQTMLQSPCKTIHTFNNNEKSLFILYFTQLSLSVHVYGIISYIYKNIDTSYFLDLSATMMLGGTVALEEEKMTSSRCSMKRRQNTKMKPTPECTGTLMTPTLGDTLSSLHGYKMASVSTGLIKLRSL